MNDAVIITSAFTTKSFFFSKNKTKYLYEVLFG